jgi:hypothetical protein
MRRFGNNVLEVDPDNNDDRPEAGDDDGDGFQILHLMADASESSQFNNITSMLVQGLTNDGLISRVNVCFNMTTSKKAEPGSKQEHTILLKNIGVLGCAKICSTSSDVAGSKSIQFQMRFCDEEARKFNFEQLHWKDITFKDGTFRGDMTQPFRTAFIWWCDMHNVQNIFGPVYDDLFGPSGQANTGSLGQTLYALAYYQRKLHVLFDTCMLTSLDNNDEEFMKQFKSLETKISQACKTRFITQPRQVLKISTLKFTTIINLCLLGI